MAAVTAMAIVLMAVATSAQSKAFRVRFDPLFNLAFSGAVGQTVGWRGSATITVDNGCLWVQPGGHRGPLRERFGIRTTGWSYGQSGIVCTVAHERPHVVPPRHQHAREVPASEAGRAGDEVSHVRRTR